MWRALRAQKGSTPVCMGIRPSLLTSFVMHCALRALLASASAVYLPESAFADSLERFSDSRSINVKTALNVYVEQNVLISKRDRLPRATAHYDGDFPISVETVGAQVMVQAQLHVCAALGCVDHDRLQWNHARLGWWHGCWWGYFGFGRQRYRRSDGHRW